MEEGLQRSVAVAAAAAAVAVSAGGVEYSDDINSCCSTPYVSAPSSPSRSGFYYSAPASPMHFMLSKTANLNSHSAASAVTDPNSSFEFDFCPTCPSSGSSAATADELFCNGQIRPTKLSTHNQRPQLLATLIESEDTIDEDQTFTRGRDLIFRTGSLRRRTRSMSPVRNPRSDEESGDCEIGTEEIIGKHLAKNEEDEEKGSIDTASCASRSSSAGRSSKRWVFLKEFLYRSKSEGRNSGNNKKFWSSIPFSPVKDKKMAPVSLNSKSKDQNGGNPNPNPEVKKKVILKNGVSKRRVPCPSPHELHYTTNRAQSEEMRKKTFLPYRQGLLGCLGFSSKSYGAMNGIARALNPVYSR